MRLEQTARRFAAADIIPVAARCDEEQRFPGDVARKAWELGLMNLEVPRELSLPEILDDLERQLILKAYQKAKGVKTETARLLGIKTSALYYKLEKYGIG